MGLVFSKWRSFVLKHTNYKKDYHCTYPVNLHNIVHAV